MFTEQYSHVLEERQSSSERSSGLYEDSAMQPDAALDDGTYSRMRA